MFIGLSGPKTPPYPIPSIDAAVIASAAEDAGFEFVSFGEHPIRPVDEGMGYSVHTEGVPLFQDTLVALSRVSAVTKKLRFAFGICILPQHNPVRLAKELACLDYYSGGRLLFGIGTGWSPDEYKAVGARFERRWAQMREMVGLMRELWTKERVEHHGEFFDVPPVQCFPQPLQKPGPPILMGARTELSLKRMVEYCDGWMPSFPTLERMANGPTEIKEGRAKIAMFAEQAGKRADQFPILANLHGAATRDDLKRFEDAGVERAAVHLPYCETNAQARAGVEKLAEALL